MFVGLLEEEEAEASTGVAVIGYTSCTRSPSTKYQHSLSESKISAWRGPKIDTIQLDASFVLENLPEKK